MKYIVVSQYPGGGTENIHLFSSTLSHDKMAQNICGPHFMKRVVAAGNIFFEEGKDEPTIMYCRGESTTLGIKSRNDVDTALLKATLNAMG